MKDLLRQVTGVQFSLGMFGGWIFAICHILFDFYVSKTMDITSFVLNDAVAFITGIGFWIFFKVKEEEINAYYSKAKVNK